jgi:phosphoadenosine phosphosulfate reductase
MLAVTTSAIPAETADPAATAQRLLAAAIHGEFAGRIALTSSFGIEAAVLLHLVADIEPSLPVLFLDTGKLFGETLRHRDRLVRRLGLRDVRTITPDSAALAAADPHGTLWHSDPGRCCSLRKIEPLSRALSGFDAWINGRRRAHGHARATLAAREIIDGRIKLNPLAASSDAEIDAYVTRHDLPRHELAGDGFLSVGCLPCSERARPGDATRDGRWRGQGRSECGIHLPQRAAATPP